MQAFNPRYTTWHITFGTYGTRLHGADRPTVDRQHNQFGTAFLAAEPQREQAEQQRMRFPPVQLTREQCLYIQDALSDICVRGGWILRCCAAAADHVHILLDIALEIHGERVRRLIKRWLTQALNAQWPPGTGRPGSLPATEASWWAEEGSNKAIKELAYLNNAFGYIEKQRMK